MTEHTDYTGALSAYIAGPRAAEVPQAVRDRARLHFLDTLGACISGSTLRPGRLIIDFVRDQGGRPEASVMASSIQAGAILAALANGTLAHADETDDAHFSTVSHPGSVVVPAALAIGERVHCSGSDLITAVVLGYDIMCRMGKAMDRLWMHERGFHSPSAFFGAAAAASRLLRLAPEQVRCALAFAGTQASGLMTWRQDPEHVDKALVFSGVPARDGVTAALWAQAGLTATRQIFEGVDNLFNAFGGDPSELTNELGSRYELLDTSIKKYPVGQPVQATLEAYFTLAQERGLSGREIAQVVVRLPESQAHTVNDRLMPDVNCQYLLAVAMLDGVLDFRNSHDFERMQAPEVLELRRRVRLVGDAELTRQFPAVRSAIVEVTTNDGRRFEKLCDRMPGAPYNPLPAAEVEEKFLMLSAPVLGAERGRRVVEQVRALEALPDVTPLGALLRL